MLQISRRLRSSPKTVHDGIHSPIQCGEVKSSGKCTNPDGPATQVRQRLPRVATLGASPLVLLGCPHEPPWTWPNDTPLSWGFSFDYFQKALDVAGSHWSWGGRPPNSQSKYLFSRPFYFSIFIDAPTTAPQSLGCRETSLDAIPATYQMRLA